MILYTYKGETQIERNTGRDWDKEFELNFGILIEPDGRKYEGYWKEDKQHEEGHYYTTKEKIEEDSGKTDKEKRK